ncbi:MAG: hypothetical protein LUE17_15545 [Planctomycetaceae bacterium]|nr:hypothetical protein [Planctomycetaceae bacterium]
MSVKVRGETVPFPVHVFESRGRVIGAGFLRGFRAASGHARHDGGHLRQLGGPVINQDVRINTAGQLRVAVPHKALRGCQRHLGAIQEGGEGGAQAVEIVDQAVFVPDVQIAFLIP